jgi:hypothetical protein
MDKFDKTSTRGVDMNQIEYPDDFLDYIIDEVVIPYIEKNKIIDEDQSEIKNVNCNMLQLKS